MSGTQMHVVPLADVITILRSLPESQQQPPLATHSFPASQTAPHRMSIVPILIFFMIVFVAIRLFTSVFASVFASSSETAFLPAGPVRIENLSIPRADKAALDAMPARRACVVGLRTDATRPREQPTQPGVARSTSSASAMLKHVLRLAEITSDDLQRYSAVIAELQAIDYALPSDRSASKLSADQVAVASDAEVRGDDAETSTSG